MMPAVQSLAGDLPAVAGKWRVWLRDEISGQILPVMVPESATLASAISQAMNRAARFVPGCDWKPLSGHRIA